MIDASTLKAIGALLNAERQAGRGTKIEILPAGFHVSCTIRHKLLSGHTVRYAEMVIPFTFADEADDAAGLLADIVGLVVGNASKVTPTAPAPAVPLDHDDPNCGCDWCRRVALDPSA
jgi:hypothetical protein